MASRSVKYALSAGALITLIMAQLCCSNSKSVSYQTKDLFEKESKLYKVKVENPQKGLNDILKTYYANNGNSLFSPYDNMPILKMLFSKVDVEKSPDPFDDIVNIVKLHASKLKENNSKIELDALTKEVALWLQRMIVSKLNKNSPNYMSGQNSVLILINGVDGNGKHQYNCVAISTFVVMVGHQMGINIYLEEVKEDSQGIKFPLDGVGHVDDVVIDSDGKETSFDQGTETLPHFVEVYDSEGNPSIVAGSQRDGFSNAKPKSFDDLVHEIADNIKLDEMNVFYAESKKAGDGAYKLSHQTNYKEAINIYKQDASRARSEYAKYKDLKFRFPSTMDLAFEDDNGVKTQVTPDVYIKGLDDRAKQDEKNADIAQHNASIPKGQSNQMQDEIAYAQLQSQINQLNADATTAFNSSNYKVAFDKYGKVVYLIDMHPEFRDKLSAEDKIAKDNQNAALTNETLDQIKSLFKTYNDDLAKPNADVKYDMQNIIKKATEILGKPKEIMTGHIQADCNNLIKAAQARLNDSALNITAQPLGGIDFNGRHLEMQIQGDQGPMAMTIDPRAWEHVRILGLIPTIIEIKPVGNWGHF